jgi:DNA invertase Pin-like site-specific DNA recombinase
MIFQIKAAKRRGLKFGRNAKLKAERIEQARKLIDKGEARQYVADLLNMGRSTLYRAGVDVLNIKVLLRFRSAHHNR